MERMGQGQRCCVQKQARSGLAGGFIGVEFVAKNGVADRLHVYPQLVGAPGVGAQVDAAGVAGGVVRQ